MLPWPVAVGMLAHALRWAALAIFGFGVATGALVACAIVGLALAPVSRRRTVCGRRLCVRRVDDAGRLPVQDDERSRTDRRWRDDDGVLHGTIAAGVTASTIILAMTLGFLVPKTLVDYVGNRSRPMEIAGAPDQVKAGSR
jgi:hypothetical protein